MTGWQLIAVSTGLALIYLYVGHRLRQFMQPIRLEIAEEGEELLADPSVPESIKGNLRFILDYTFSTQAAFLIVVFHPIAWFVRKPRAAIASAHARLDSDQKRAVRDVYRKGLMCVVANSPFTFVLFCLEILLFDIILPARNGIARTVAKSQSAREWVERHSFQH